MRDIRVGVAQFEARDRDKEYNLGRIRDLTERAVEQGAELVSFHECCIPGYTFLMELRSQDIESLAEKVPGGPSVRALEDISRTTGACIGAGLVELEDGNLFNTYVVVSPDGFVAKFRKLHPFVSKYFSPGESYTTFELLGCKWGVLICYDNNLPENVRVTSLLGADIILMPHVTCGLESVMPGRGKIAPEVWENRDRDPVRLRQEFDGPKGRGWLMRWLPCRAYENGIYALFTNAVGVDHDTIKNGASMILDPYGEIVSECRELGDDVVVGLLTPEKIDSASGRRYQRARRPELYDKLVEPHPHGAEPVTLPGWKLADPES
ncbi:MAG: nitrilase family protein [Planctomycetota bacterium]